MRDEYQINDYEEDDPDEGRVKPSPRGGKSQQNPSPLRTTQTYTNGFHKIQFENGVYEGHMQDNKRHGSGRYVWNDGNVYDGDWVDDVKQGRGRFEWENGDIYEGDYVEDRREGTGTKYYANGDTYEVV